MPENGKPAAKEKAAKRGYRDLQEHMAALADAGLQASEIDGSCAGAP